MKNIIILLSALVGLTAFAQLPVPPRATQAEVDARANVAKYVSPDRLSTNAVANATNAQYAATAATATNLASNVGLATNTFGWLDLPYVTNNYLMGNNPTAAFLAAVRTRAGVTFDIGDSMVAGISGTDDSASQQLEIMEKNAYGNSGRAWWDDWDVSYNPSFFSRPEKSAWFTTYVAVGYGTDGTNEFHAMQGVGKAQTNFVTQVQLVTLLNPLGTNYSIRISSISSRYTNFYVLNGYSPTNLIIVTNFPASGNDNEIYITTFPGGTNLYLMPGFIKTNAGVFNVELDAGGTTLDVMTNSGLQNWRALATAYNPDQIVYHAKDISESTTGAIFTNRLVSLINAAKGANTQVILIGTPPVLGFSYQDNNYWLRQTAEAQGWYYADLWGRYNNFASMTNSFMMADGTHPNVAGSIAWASALWQLLNFAPNPFQLNPSQMAVNGGSYKFQSGTNVYEVGMKTNEFGVRVNGKNRITVGSDGLTRIIDDFNRVAVDFNNGASGIGGISIYNNPTITLNGSSTTKMLSLGGAPFVLQSTSGEIDLQPGSNGTSTNLAVYFNRIEARTNMTVFTTLTASNGIATYANNIPVAATVGASPYNFTNTSPVAMECYFSGGVAYSVSKLGAAVYGSLVGNDYFVLQPSDYCTVTYTVAPTFFTNSW